jgi:hypothetical protein
VIPKLSRHFSLAEFTASDTAARLGIDNTPDAETVTHLVQTAAMLERIRLAVGLKLGADVPIIVSSGYRCRELNRAIGSKDSSHHVHGHAADIKCPAFGFAIELAKLIAAQMDALQVGQVIHEFGAWVHVSTRWPDADINRILTIDRQGTRPGILEARHG